MKELAEQYPDSRSAVMPALRLAQAENGGWLSAQSFEEVGAALGLTPAYCQSIASFYDMYHLAPTGRHLVEDCTNVSCALVGAQRVLGVRPGESTEDGEVTLRTMECAGGCGWAPVVVVDHRYREPTTPEDVPAVVQELRGG